MLYCPGNSSRKGQPSCAGSRRMPHPQHSWCAAGLLVQPHKQHSWHFGQELIRNGLVIADFTLGQGKWAGWPLRVAPKPTVQDFKILQGSGGFYPWPLQPLPASSPPGYLLHRAGKYSLILLVIALRNTCSLIRSGMKHPFQHGDTCSPTFAALPFFFLEVVRCWHSLFPLLPLKQNKPKESSFSFSVEHSHSERWAEDNQDCGSYRNLSTHVEQMSVLHWGFPPRTRLALPIRLVPHTLTWSIFQSKFSQPLSATLPFHVLKVGKYGKFCGGLPLVCPTWSRMGRAQPFLGVNQCNSAKFMGLQQFGWEDSSKPRFHPCTQGQTLVLLLHYSTN